MRDRLRREVVAPASKTARKILVQRKLAVGSADDVAEREADQVADLVVGLLKTPSTRSHGEVTSEQPGKIRRASTASAPVGDAIDSGTESRIQRARGGGRGLDAPMLESMESAFGTDMSDVRIHTDDRAATLSRQLDARAFTAGSDVFFGAGEYQPDTSGGQHLLAHELAHTVQQGGPQPIRRALSLNKTKWADAKSMSASSGSATGVFFLKDKGGKTIVVKGAHGTARLEMAGEIMEAAGGEAVPQRMIALKSSEGKKLLSVMKSLAKKVPVDPTTNKNEVLDKFNTQLAGGQYDAVQVMEAYENLSNIQEAVEKADMAQLLPMMLKNGFFRQLGRIHAADVFMGNDDRMSKGFGPAIKNIFVNVKTGQAVGLDMELNAHSFEQVTGDLRGPDDDVDYANNSPSLEGKEYLDFVNYSISGDQAEKEYLKRTKASPQGKVVKGKMGMRGGEQGVLPQSDALDQGRIAKLFDAFSDDFTAEAGRVGNAANKKVLESFDWTAPKQQFVAGVAQGMKNIGDKSGALAASADKKVGKSGAQAMFDPNVFRIRAMYAKLKEIGYTDENEIIAVLVEYAEFLHNGGKDEAFLRTARQKFLQSHGGGIGGSSMSKAPIMPKLPSLPSRPGEKKKELAKSTSG